MPGFLPSVAALTAAALTAGPVVAGPVVAAPPSITDAAYSVCEQRISGAGNTQQLSPEQAAELLQRARELVTELSSVVGDNRAIGLADQFRSMGVTPAVASGWRQQAHDLADALMTSMNDPRAKDAAVALARAGFSPTPADLRFTPHRRPQRRHRPHPRPRPPRQWPYPPWHPTSFPPRPPARWPTRSAASS
ncbi:hypothetical protein ACFQV8_33510 [Pseudonocardia benzenivorans]